MIFQNMINLNVWSACAVVKVDDTGSGIEAGVHAGCWVVGIAKTVRMEDLSFASKLYSIQLDHEEKGLTFFDFTG